MSADVVHRYYEALGNGDFDAARRLLKDDLRFKGPFDEFDNADDYAKAIQALWGMVRSVDIQHMWTDGAEVAVIYDMVTDTPAGTQLVCEWYGIEGGKIARIRVVFDTAPFAFLRGGPA
jgi:ketosteroid isomerase-like protein